MGGGGCIPTLRLHSHTRSSSSSSSECDSDSGMFGVLLRRFLTFSTKPRLKLFCSTLASEISSFLRDIFTMRLLTFKADKHGF